MLLLSGVSKVTRFASELKFYLKQTTSGTESLESKVAAFEPHQLVFHNGTLSAIINAINPCCNLIP